MAAYEFVALDEFGKRNHGVVEADSDRHARQILRERKQVPISLTFSDSSAQASSGLLSRFYRLSTLELALITRQLATLVRAGMSLEKALSALVAQHESRRVKKIILLVRSRLMEGFSFAVSLEQAPWAFNKMYRATIAAGEESGNLDEVLMGLAHHMERADEFQKNVGMAMIYPAVLVFLSLAIIGGLFVFVMPKITDAFTKNDQTLPWLTSTLIAISEFMVSYFWFLLIGIGLFIFCIKLILQQEAVRMQVHRLILELPIIRRFSSAVNASRFANTFSTLHSSGVPLLDALKIASNVIPNLWLQHCLEDCIVKVSEGLSLSKALGTISYFPPIMLQMIASGESSGDLDDLLAQVAKNQQDEVERKVTIFLRLFEPLMLLVMGGMVLLIVLAILLPIWDLNQLA